MNIPPIEFSPHCFCADIVCKNGIYLRSCYCGCLFSLFRPQSSAFVCVSENFWLTSTLVVTGWCFYLSAIFVHDIEYCTSQFSKYHCHFCQTPAGQTPTIFPFWNFILYDNRLYRLPITWYESVTPSLISGRRCVILTYSFILQFPYICPTYVYIVSFF